MRVKALPEEFVEIVLAQACGGFYGGVGTLTESSAKWPAPLCPSETQCDPQLHCAVLSLCSFSKEIIYYRNDTFQFGREPDPAVPLN